MKHWHYKNTAFLVLSIIVFLFLADTPQVKNIITAVGGMGYFGAFLAGIFFVSIFTVAPASVVLFYIAETLDPFGVALAAGLGGMVGDYMIFRFFKDKIFEELEPLFMESGGNALAKLFKSPHFAWMIPVAGAVIVASPLPDEPGLALLGLTKIKGWHFFMLTFFLDTAGIFAVVTAAKLF